jgi:Hsp20/alpha crystallin family
MSVRDLIPWGRGRSPGVRGGEVMDPFVSLHREVNRLFDDFVGDFGSRLPSAGFGGLGWGGLGWPHTDVVENDKEYRVTAELPGLEEKDVDLTFQDGVLTLKGEKKVEHGGDARDPITTPAARLLPVPLREPDAAKHGGILALCGRTARPRPQRAVAMTVLFVQNIPTA